MKVLLGYDLMCDTWESDSTMGSAGAQSQTQVYAVSHRKYVIVDPGGCIRCVCVCSWEDNDQVTMLFCNKV